MMIRVIILTLMSELLLFHKFYTSVISGRKEKVCFVVFLAKKKKETLDAPVMVLCFSLRHKFYTEFRHKNEIA